MGIMEKKMETTILGLGFPKIRGTILGVPMIRTIVFRGLYWGPPILANYYINPCKDWGFIVEVLGQSLGLRLQPRITTILCKPVLSDYWEFAEKGRFVPGEQIQTPYQLCLLHMQHLAF